MRWWHSQRSTSCPIVDCPSFRTEGRRARRRKANLRKTKSLIEPLEDRHLLTTTLFIDFGEAFPEDGLQTTASELVTAIQGPDFTDPSRNVQLAPDEAITIESFRSVVEDRNIDFNGDGNADIIDAFEIRFQVRQLVEQALEPFDIDVELVSVNDLGDVTDLYELNNGDATGEHDSWIAVGSLLAGSTSSVECDDSIGCLIEALGVASPADFGHQADDFIGLNDEDNAAVVFADQIPETGIEFTLANTILHEAGHTWGLRHTAHDTDEATLLGLSEIMESDGVEFVGRQIFSDYDLNLGSDGIMVPVAGFSTNGYQFLSSDPDIGPSDVAYISGTGAHDLITACQRRPKRIASVRPTVQRSTTIARARACRTVVHVGHDTVREHVAHRSRLWERYDRYRRTAASKSLGSWRPR